MMQLREVRLVGSGKRPASVDFKPGGNAISGDSDTGKSYIFRLIDFVFGAEEIKKIEEDAGYETAFVELQNAKGAPLTLARNLTGGDVKVYRSTIDKISGDGEVVLARRRGTTKEPDVTSVLFEFAGLKEATLRANARGSTSRLSVRVLMPMFAVNEHAMIAERSPTYGEGGYNHSASQRALSYLVTSVDDEGIIAAEKTEIVNAQVHAQINLITELLKPIEARLSESGSPDGEDNLATIERADNSIQSLSGTLAESQKERESLRSERADWVKAIQAAETQLLALDELLSRYKLLNERYDSDLQRLDFVSEGSHYLQQLQQARCPVCDQPMDAKHKAHFESSNTNAVYLAARAEAAKIKGLRDDLKEAVAILESRHEIELKNRSVGETRLREIDRRIELDLAPSLHASKEQLDLLFVRRVELESVKSDFQQAEDYRKRLSDLEGSIQKGTGAKKWAPIDPIATRNLCNEIEDLLKEWGWKDDVRVEFDDKKFDLKVDGKPRASHGKGYGALLHAAFIIGLLRFCKKSRLPHPGFVVMDSPITTFKKGEPITDADRINESIEALFWSSLSKTSKDIQVIVIDNKEPLSDTAKSLHYHFFAGDNAKPGERVGFIPVES
jgi:hypothetical protein